MSTEKSKLLEMHNMGIVVENLDSAISFFTEIGLKLEGRSIIEGEWAGRITGLGSQEVEMAMMVTPDGHSRLEITKFLSPAVISDHRTAPVNSLGYLRIMFRVDNLDELVSRLVSQGAELVGEVVQYENVYRLCYIRGVEGLLIGLAEQLSPQENKVKPEPVRKGLSTSNRIIIAVLFFAVAVFGFMLKLPSAFRGIDKELHAVFYFLAAAFLNVLFAKRNLVRHIIIFIALYVFGLAIEYSQAYSNRFFSKRIHGRFDPEDVEWNLDGLIAFSLLWIVSVGLIMIYKTMSSKNKA
jgi:catechol 2,3-dioxygenase-like lactoylglutathione lyase family enzyme